MLKPVLLQNAEGEYCFMEKGSKMPEGYEEVEYKVLDSASSSESEDGVLNEEDFEDLDEEGKTTKSEEEHVDFDKEDGVFNSDVFSYSWGDLDDVDFDEEDKVSKQEDNGVNDFSYFWGDENTNLEHEEDNIEFERIILNLIDNTKKLVGMFDSEIIRKTSETDVSYTKIFISETTKIAIQMTTLVEVGKLKCNTKKIITEITILISELTSLLRCLYQ